VVDDGGVGLRGELGTGAAPEDGWQCRRLLLAAHQLDSHLRTRTDSNQTTYNRRTAKSFVLCGVHLGGVVY
jgi:hypothetical protein